MLRMIPTLLLSREKGKTTCRICGKSWELDSIDPKFVEAQKEHFHESPRCVVIKKVLTK